MLEAWVGHLNIAIQIPCRLAEDRAPLRPGYLVVAPGDKHMVVDAETYEIRLVDGPKEHFLRPAADPLFRSVAAAFGAHSIGIVMTGMGCDGTEGAAHIASAGGTVLVQDPATAVAPSMPKAVGAAGIPHRVFPLSELSRGIRGASLRLSKTLPPERRSNRATRAVSAPRTG